MMIFLRRCILPMLMLFIVSPAFPQDNDLWSRINETTWSYEDSWTDGAFVFFETTSGQKMALRQIYGSGVIVSGSILYPIVINDDSIGFYQKTDFSDMDAPDFQYTMDGEKRMVCPEGVSPVLSLLYEKPFIANAFEEISVDEIKQGDFSKLNLLPEK